MIKAILFDMDGILYDSEYYYMNGTIDQMRQYGYQGSEEAVYAIMGTTMEDTYRILYDLLDHRVPMETIIKGNERYFHEEHPINFKEIMFEGVPEVLRQLKEEGIRTAVCSSSPYDLIVESLKAMEIEDCFDFIESGENVPHAKPAPDIYLLAAEALGMAKEECIVYEDSALGIEAGKRAGIYTVARRDDRFHQDQSAADQKIDDIRELIPLIRKENTQWQKK